MIGFLIWFMVGLVGSFFYGIVVRADENGLTVGRLVTAFALVFTGPVILIAMVIVLLAHFWDRKIL